MEVLIAGRDYFLITTSWSADFFKNPEKDYYIIEGGVRYRFSNKFSLELSHRYETETDYIISAGRDATGQPINGLCGFQGCDLDTFRYI